LQLRAREDNAPAFNDDVAAVTNRVCLLLLVKVGNISEIINQGMTKFPPGMNAESFAAMKNKVRGWPRIQCAHT